MGLVEETWTYPGGLISNGPVLPPEGPGTGWITSMSFGFGLLVR